MRPPFRPRSFVKLPFALAALLSLFGAGADARPRAHPRAAAPSGPQPSFVGSGDDGQSMIRAQSGVSVAVHGAADSAGAGHTQARPGYIGGTDDGQSIRRTQPGHHGGNHPHRGR
jgi:hypothetical protein